ncbi:hypothetical protein PoB_004056800 [Plakobranchus ocellatus]|uniref:Uncharacterized protein n=1 Tax=Plakobranchus ocellatus TaxID=259542 RepID=A0AAV4B3A7_9GAST|nr:hypothetical protein PoB_004056800 [Plakobranchus ocellatus]
MHTVHPQQVDIWLLASVRPERGDVGSTVNCKPTLKFAEIFLSRVRARRRRPGLTEGLKAWNHLVVDWQYIKTKLIFVSSSWSIDDRM